MQSAPFRQVFVDTETTGLEVHNGDRIVELACVEMVDRRLTGNHRHFYVNPQRPSDAEALRVHGITDEFLADKPLFGAIAGEFIEFLSGAEVIIHNAPFDIAFLDDELQRAGLAHFGARLTCVVDSLRLARELFPGKVNSLDMLCRRLEVDNSTRTTHGALLDANLLANVYIAMTRGQHTLSLESDGHVALESGGRQNLSTYELSVVPASPDEMNAHEALMADIAGTKKSRPN